MRCCISILISLVLLMLLAHLLLESMVVFLTAITCSRAGHICTYGDACSIVGTSIPETCILPAKLGAQYKGAWPLQVQEMLEDTEIFERLQSVRKYAKSSDGKADFPIAPQRPPQLSPDQAYSLRSWVDETDNIVLSR